MRPLVSPLRVDGRPLPWELVKDPRRRGRYAPLGYVPDDVRAWQDSVTLVVGEAVRKMAWWRASRQLYEGPVLLVITFIFWRPRHPKCEIPIVRKRADLDRLITAVMDAMTGVVYVDDCQVAQLIVLKRYQNTEEEQPGVTLEASALL